MASHTEHAAHSQGAGHSADHGHSEHDVRKEVKKYIFVFVALLVGTVVTVGMYYVHIPSVAWTIAIALFIATIKAALVAGYFMHLISERKAIYAILLSTVFFFASMMYLIVWHREEVPSRSTWWEGNVGKKEDPRAVTR